MKWILVILSISIGSCLYGQAVEEYKVYFEAGQASISLEQLDSIKTFVQPAKEEANTRVIVKTYANDALNDDANQHLSGRRAYLLQQCLERDGIALGHMQIENKVQADDGIADHCGQCAYITLTTDENFSYQNVYHDRVAEYLIEESGVQAQTFWIKPFEDVILSTKDGLIVRVPKDAFETKDGGLIKFEVRFLQNAWEMLLHSLTTRSVDQASLKLNRAVHLEASQYGMPLSLKAGQEISIVLPTDEYTKSAAVYAQQDNRWGTTKEASVYVGSFFGGDQFHCNASGDGLAAFNFNVPPSKPVYLVYDSVTVVQDEQLKTIKMRLEHLNSQKIDKKGKPKELSASQKRIENQLRNKKHRLLVAKEKLKIEAREENERREKIYYQALAAYNKQRNAQQRGYIKSVDSVGNQQREMARRCAEHRKNTALLQESYGQADYERIAATLRNQKVMNSPLGYWVKTNKMGWMSIGANNSRASSDVVPYRVTSPISAYKITAFLIFDETKDIVLGETLDDTDIVFWEVPDGKNAKILAVTQEGDNFLVAFHRLTTSGNPIKLDFKQLNLQDLLERL